MGDGLPQGFHIGEAALRAQETAQGDGQLLAVQVAGKIEEIAFHPQGAGLLHGGADAEIGDGGMAGAIRQGDPRRINAEGGHPFAGGDNDIGGGKAEGVAEMVSLDDTAGKGELFFHKITDAEAAKRFCRRGRSQRR